MPPNRTTLPIAMTEDRHRARRLPLSPRRLALVALAVAVVALAIWLLRDTLTFETLRENRETLLAWRDANYLLAAAGYMAVYVTVIALSLPGGAVMTLTGGFLFGLVPGTAMTVLAATTGASLIFLAARAGFGDALHRRITAEGSGGVMKRLEAGLRENAFNYLLMIRLVPAFPFWLINLAPAFLGIQLHTYVAATFLGIIPGTAVYTWIGAGLGEVFARGEEPDLGLIFDPIILSPILGLAALAVLPVVIRKLRGQGVAE
jgi:uncharacterized membrane protein YdjX (TVP38/TMEM64 family)